MIVKYFCTIRNISLSIHWIFTELSLKAFTLMASAGVEVMSFAADFYQAAAGTMIGGGRFGFGAT